MKYLSITIVVFLFVSCHFNFTNSLTLDQNARDFLDIYYDALRQKDYKKVNSYISDEFFVETPKAKWTKIMRTIQNKLGDFQTIGIHSFQSRTIMGTTGNKKLVQICLTNQWSRYTSEEYLYLSAIDTAPYYEVVGHRINSDGLILE